MACPIDAKEIEKLKMFIQFCSMSPHILHRPELGFFKTFVEQLGGAVPEAPKQKQPAPEETPKPTKAEPKAAPADSDDEPEEEEDNEPEIDREGCVDEPDSETPHEMGDSTKEPSEQDMDQANELRGKAQALFSERKFDEAIDMYTQAILLNPMALFFAKRGQCFLKSQKPNACIRDCNAALEKNPDSAAAYKFRGRANRLLGRWEDSARDLRQACKIDFDEEADEWLREVTPKAHKIEQYRIDRERRQNEREIQARIKRNQKAREAHRRAAEEEKANPGMGMGGGMPGAGAGGFPFGNMGGGAGMQGMFEDPDIQKVMMEILSDPSKLAQYAADPKYKPLFDMMGMMGGGAGGAGGGMPFSFGGAGAAEDDAAPTASEATDEAAAEPQSQKPTPKSSNLSDDLD